MATFFHLSLSVFLRLHNIIYRSLAHIIIRYIFSSFSLAESTPRGLQITAYK